MLFLLLGTSMLFRDRFHLGEIKLSPILKMDFFANVITSFSTTTRGFLDLPVQLLELGYVVRGLSRFIVQSSTLSLE